MIRNLLIFSFILLIQAHIFSQETSKVDFIQLSQNFLTEIKARNNTDLYTSQYKDLDLLALDNFLNTKEKHLTFWMNTYNAFIQEKLLREPKLYENRSNFFKSDFIDIGGQLFSFDLIEHGIIRNSRWKLGLGYIKKLFPSSLERQLRMKGKDGRVHFALNCGAKTCPPVEIYRVEDLDEQLTSVISKYLTGETDIKDNQITTVPLFSWFRGDFGGKKGIRKFLSQYLQQDLDGFDINYGPYDWTLHLDNFVP